MRWLLPCLVAVLLLPAAQAAPEITAIVAPHPPLSNLTGTLALTLLENVTSQARVTVTLDSGLSASLPIPNLPLQQLKPFSFTYVLTATGESAWLSYPSQQFAYRAHVSALCSPLSNGTVLPDGNRSGCTCNPPYPCNWFGQMGEDDLKTVSADQGLVKIRDAGQEIVLPSNATSVVWTDIANPINPNVTVTLRAACGSETYQTHQVAENGWVSRSIPAGDIQAIPGSSSRVISMEPFDTASVTTARTLYGSSPIGPGGLYRLFADGTLSYVAPGSSGHTAAYWGHNGTIVLNAYDSNAQYLIGYLPPNGPRVCALSAAVVRNVSAWTVSKAYIDPNQAVTIDKPYTKAFPTEAHLANDLPPPVCPVQPCNRTVLSYSGVEVTDPSDAVAFSFDPAARTVSATTVRRDLLAPFTVAIPLRGFNLTVPTAGDRILTLQASDPSSGFNLQNTTALSVCADSDRDGVCAPQDCNDNAASINPGAPELCNGIDDDCDGEIDTPFRTAENRIGGACGTPNSKCAGVIVCTPDGKNVTCNAKHRPGELQPVCGSGEDNDCNGIVDDKQVVNQSGVIVPLCKDICKSGDNRSCGSRFGICKAGIQFCEKGQWGECTGQTGPRQEVCNAVDDNCDSIVDNINVPIGDPATVAQSLCACAGGAQPKAEACNGIDDDCNGQVDDGIVCCASGDTRTCGLSTGECETGQELCVDGRWSGVCDGAVHPLPEVCDGLDNDCNSAVDDSCVELPPTGGPGATPSGWPVSPLILILLGGMIILGVGFVLRLGLG